MNLSHAIRQEILHTGQDLWQFVKAPRLDFLPDRPHQVWVVAFLTVVFVDIAILDNILDLFFYLIETNGYNPPTPIESNWSDYREYISLLFLAPLIEELAFRGWVNGRKRNIIAFIAFSPLIFFEFTNLVGVSESVIAVVSLILIVAVPAWWMTQSRKPQPVPVWFAKNFRWIIYGSAVVFGLTHISSYFDFEWGPDALYVLPQAVGGLLMAYTRLRFGLLAAMLHHALFNAYYIGAELLAAY
jgi:membrane protease YdiL (CAAX protease family)